jgi:hypothetical protein
MNDAISRAAALAVAWMPIYEPELYRPEGDDKHEG